jgi:hypothetical protein
MPAYAPNDSSLTVDDLASLRTPTGRSLLHEVAALLAHSAAPAVNDVARLRRHYSAQSVHAALTLAQLQPRAREKFPDLAEDFIYALPEALEQATDTAIASHKASRFHQAGATHILDLCCGIGGDTRALAGIAPVTAIDLSAARLACLQYNLQPHPPTHPITTQIADVTTIPLPRDALFHIDPARRSHGKRSARFADLIPGPDFLQRLIHELPGGALKLSPAVDFDSLPSDPPAHLEIISHNRSVVQAVLWTGKLAALFPPNTRTATMFTNHQLITTFTASSGRGSISERPGNAPFYLYEADPAFTRSQLAHALAHDLGLISLTDDGGYLASPAANPLVTHSALTPFQVLTLIPYSEKNVIAQLHKSSGAAPQGAVEVKTRGKIPAINTDHLQVLFSKAVPRRQTVLIFRHAGGICAAIATRIN